VHIPGHESRNRSFISADEGFFRLNATKHQSSQEKMDLTFGEIDVLGLS